MQTSKITVQTVVASAAQKAWDHYTQPEHITKWNFASDDWQCPSASNDMRVGGKYSARMEAKDGSFGFDFEAIYEDIVPGKSFTYVMGDGRAAQVSFDGQGQQTAVTVTFDAENENPVEMQKGGWQAILNNYKKYTEAH
ncbi:SRPBCC family protein [Chitinophaga qingshengii]|uniref:SRPBCC family protein n=1 Tax=Chitinophaga qingshengii TaxID=1569794 RepID=A0ABR7TMU2_9BACT|nr:SRPBCC family protein [Chitinophaga qingshengii]MBC9931801.1 SRPBCC family protein [Chitinophaga qingshengii]